MNDEMEEAPRPEPDFRVRVKRAFRPEVDVTDAVMDVYDIAVNSMDFGSGFLSTEEVGNLRTLGEAIGAKRFDYQYDKCLRCGHKSGQHYQVSAPGPNHKHFCFVRSCSCTGFVNSAYAPPQ